MKKLLISSTAFFCLSTMNFFLLRLDRFIQFLYTAWVIISLEFVLRISAWQSTRTCSLCRSRESKSVLFQNFVSEFRDFLQRVAPFYLETVTTTTTNQTTGLLVRSDRLVFGMRQRASDRLRRRRNPRLRRTIARGTVARSRTLDLTRRESLWGSSRWAHNWWRRSSFHWTPSLRRRCAGLFTA